MDIPAGLKGQKEVMVMKENTALAHGSGTLEVFATPAMVALMEQAAQSSVQAYLSEGHTTVGGHLDIKHVKPTPVGLKVYAKSTLASAEGRKLVFNVEAFDEEGKIGFGVHTRYIVDASTFGGGKG